MAFAFGRQIVFADDDFDIDDDDIFAPDRLLPPPPSYAECNQSTSGHFQLNINPGLMFSWQVTPPVKNGQFKQLQFTTMQGIPNDTGHVSEFSALVVDEREFFKTLRFSLSGSGELSGTAVMGLSPRTEMKCNFVLPGMPNGQPPRHLLTSSFAYKGDSWNCGLQTKNMELASANFMKTLSPYFQGGTELIINKDEGTNLGFQLRYKDPSPLVQTGTFVASVNSDYILNMVYSFESRSYFKGVKCEVYGPKRESVVTLLHKTGNKKSLYEATIDTTGVLGATLQMQSSRAVTISASWYHPLNTPQFAYGVGITVNR